MIPELTNNYFFFISYTANSLKKLNNVRCSFCSVHGRDNSYQINYNKKTAAFTFYTEKSVQKMQTGFL